MNLEGDTLLAQSKSKYISPADIATIYIFAGNKERALDCLEQAYEVRDPNVIYTGIYPQFSIINQHINQLLQIINCRKQPRTDHSKSNQEPWRDPVTVEKGCIPDSP